MRSGSAAWQINSFQFRQKLAITFRTLRHRNYRLYFAGELVSVCGTWMQNLAASWLVYRLTGETMALAALAFARLSPMLIFGLVGGYLCDRFPKKRILVCTQTSYIAASLCLAWLTISGQVAVWHVLAVTAFMGIVTAFDMPAQQALVADMVPPEDLVNAVSLNAFLFNCGRTVSPVVAGLVVGLWGEGVCFALNAASFFASLAAIASVKTDYARHSKHENGDVKKAIHFVCHSPTVRNALLLALSFAFFGMQYLMLMPVFCVEVLHGAVGQYGFITAAVGLGSFVASLLVANVSREQGLIAGNVLSGLGFALALLVLSQIGLFSLAWPITCLVAFFAATQLICTHSLVQSQVPPRLRGKVVSLYLAISMGTGPFGSLFAGWLAGHFGARAALSVCALVCALAAAVYWLSGVQMGLAANPALLAQLVNRGQSRRLR